MTESADCRCESILSPQMEYVPGVHHEVGCPMRRDPANPVEAVAGILREALPDVPVYVADGPDSTLADTGNFIVRVPWEET